MPNNHKDMQRVMQAIRRHKRFTVTAHINPEGDALGSAMALAALIRRLGKQAIVANDGGIPASLEFLPRLAPVIAKPGEAKMKPEVAMTTDVPVFSRVGVMQPLLKSAPLLVCIDHHVSNQRFADINWVDPTAAAVGEMIYRLYEAFRVKPTRDEAICMYTSLVSDTGSFRYMNTTPAVHDIASKLLATGVSPLKISQALYENHTAANLRFLGDVLSKVQQTPDGRAAWLEVSQAQLKKSKATPDVVDELVNYPRSIKTAEVAFTLREAPEKGKIRVSFRSKGRVDVNVIAQHFSGGGHKAASGCTVNGTLSQARAQVLKVVRHALKKS